LQADQQSRRIKHRKDAAERVVGGNAMGQFEKAPQEVEFRLAKAFDIDPGVRIGDHGAESDHDEILQHMAARAFQARVGKIFKVRGKLLQRVEGRHPSPPG
jgi:hypothetical protein